MAEEATEARRSNRGVRVWKVLRALALGPIIVVGWIALILWIVALGLEQTGLLNQLATTEIGRRLGPVANDFRMAQTEVDWLRRAVRFSGISTGKGGGDVVINELELVFGWQKGRGPALERAEIKGGNLRISRALMNGVQGLVQAQPRGGDGTPAPLPTLIVNRLAVEVETPNWGDLQIGQVDACLRPAPGDLRHLTGRLLPPGSSPDRSGGEVYLNGELDREGVLFVRAVARALPLSTSYLPQGTPLDGLRDWDASAMLDLEATGHFDAARTLFPTFETRLSLSEGELEAPFVSDPELSRLGNMQFDLHTNFRPSPNQALWDLDAWSGTAKLSADWRDEPAEAWLLIGDDSTPGHLAEGWLHLPRVAADRRLAQISDARIWKEIMAQFAPQGTGALSFGLRFPDRWSLRDDFAREVERCLRVQSTGGLSVAYHGRESSPGVRDKGFPLRVGQIDGHFVYAFNPEITLPEQMGFVELEGRSAGGEVEVEGFVHSRPRWFLATGAPLWMSEWEFFLGGRGTDLAVGDEIEAGLTGLAGVLPPEDFWERYQPEDGRVDFDLGLWHNTTAPGLASRVGIDIRDAKTRWRDFPMQLEDTHGRIDFWFDGTPAVSGTAGWAVDVNVEAESGAVMFPVLVEAQARGEASGPTGAQRGSVSHTLVRAESANLRDRELRGVLNEHRKKVIKVLDSVGAAGFVNLELTHARVRDGQNARFLCEIQPADEGVEILPAAFPMPTRNLEGRAILASEIAEGQADAPVDVHVSPLIGTWTSQGGPTPIAIRAHFPPASTAQLELMGSGLDTTNRSLLGSIRTALQPKAPDASVDLSAVGFEGELDVSAIVDLEGEESAVRQLKGHLRSGVFGDPARPLLKDLRGELSWQDNRIQADSLQATLGTTPVELTNFRLQTRDGLTEMQTNLSVEGLPLDFDHLGCVLDPDTLTVLLDGLRWDGRVDVRNGRLDVTHLTGEEPIVRFRGALGVSGMSIDLGVPISIQSAEIPDLDLTVESGAVRALARVRDLYGQIAGHQVERARMMATFVEPHLSIQQLEGQFAGGSLRSRGDTESSSIGASLLSIDLVPPFPFRLAFEVERVDAGQLLAGIFNSDFANEGQVQAALSLVGNIEKLTDISGSGYSTLSDSALWSIPVFQDLFSQLGFESSATFNEMGSHFTIEDGTVVMTNMRVKSDLLTLVGEGSLDFEGHLDYDLEVQYSLVDRLGPFTRLLYIIQNSLLRISIRGDMSRPKVILKGIISQFLPNVGDGPPELPIPGYSNLPRRF